MATITSKTTSSTTRKYSSISTTITNASQSISKVDNTSATTETIAKQQNTKNPVPETKPKEVENGTKAEETGLKKTKSKKSKKSGELKQKVSVKSSSHKFEALQKKNAHSVKTQRQDEVVKEVKQNCRLCDKIVYKMEEIKAQNSIWHSHCFKCDQCGKQLSVDTYQSHEGTLYCKPHYKLLFAPKVVQNDEPEKPKKPVLIICENQPEDLPSDVVRASDKADLGLEELHRLNVKSRFEIFEKGNAEPKESPKEPVQRSTSSAKILKKLTKFEKKPVKNDVADEHSADSSDESCYSVSENDENDDDGVVAGLIRSDKRKREKPMHLSNMSDIKTKFESGITMTKEERREERKQEIQNIRSRLFMGKQARIKEMYQQAVEESQQGKTGSAPKIDAEIGEKMKNIAERFEKGEAFSHQNDEEEELNNRKGTNEDMSIFEQGLSKKSRSLFIEMDATAAKESPQQPQSPRPDRWSRVNSFVDEKQKPVNEADVVKCDENQDDVKIDTSDILSKFKFFETYKPAEKEKREFRITPPRDGVVKLPSPDQEDSNKAEVEMTNGKADDSVIAKQCHTATKMLSKFKQMEENQGSQENISLKPLKRFTPPRDANKHLYYSDQEDRELSETDEEDEEEEMVEEEEDEQMYGNHGYVRSVDDEFLKQAQSAARAKQLRAKFEKWEQSEIEREKNNSTNIYDVYDDSQTESTRTIRDKFESMREAKKVSAQPKIQVHRFV